MRKYQTEFSLDVYPQFKTLIPAAQLEYFEEESGRKFHIYGILLGPRFFVKPESIKQYENYISIVLFTNAEGECAEYQINFSIEKDLDHTKLKIDSTYPHSILKVEFDDESWAKDKFGSNEIKIDVSELFNVYANSLVDRINYKVLYIGQAYGKNGERSAIERLSQHGTFQKILIDCRRNYSEYEIYLLLLDMNYGVHMGITKPSVFTEKEKNDDESHTREVLSDLPKEQQVINITEAAIINYFKPEYNSDFVENFPCPQHRSYKQYYDLDYNEIVVELDMEFDRFPFVELYTDTARIKSCRDFIHYKLENEERESMYSLFK